MLFELFEEQQQALDVTSSVMVIARPSTTRVPRMEPVALLVMVFATHRSDHRMAGLPLCPSCKIQITLRMTIVIGSGLVDILVMTLLSKSYVWVLALAPRLSAPVEL